MMQLDGVYTSSFFLRTEFIRTVVEIGHEVSINHDEEKNDIMTEDSSGPTHSPPSKTKEIVLGNI